MRRNLVSFGEMAAFFRSVMIISSEAVFLTDRSAFSAAVYSAAYLVGASVISRGNEEEQGRIKIERSDSRRDVYLWSFPRRGSSRRQYYVIGYINAPLDDNGRNIGEN